MKNTRPSQTRTILFRYGFAVLTVVLVTVLRVFLNPLLGTTAVPFILYFPAILLSGWYGGLGPGLLATFLSALGALYFNIDTNLSIPTAYDAFRLGLFLIEGVFISLITEAWHRARAALVESKDAESQQRELLQVTLSSVGDAIIATDSGGRVTFMNMVSELLTGWKREEAAGKPLDAVFRIINETTRATVESPAARVLRENTVIGLANHTILIRKDGTEIPIDDSGAPIKQKGGEIIGVVLVFRDISTRKLVEEERAFAASIVESSDDAIIGKSLEGMILSWNAGAERMYGYTAEEVMGQHISLLAPNERKIEIEQILDKLRHGERVYHFETIRVRKDGNSINVALSISPIKNAQGEVIGASTIAHDITERKRSEDAQHFLAEASSVLSSTLDYETTLASVAQLIVPRLADWCIVAIVEENEPPRLFTMAHNDPLKIEFARELIRRYPPDPNSQIGVSNVLRTGKSEVYQEFPDEMLVAAARDDQHLKLLQELGVKSVMVVPLIAGGRTIGAISMISAESGRRFDKRDLALAEDLAQRAAFAIDNARLYREAQTARDDAEQANRAKDDFLATVSHELRTPLNAIVGWSHMMRRNKFDEATTARAMETIERNAKSQARLIEDILDVSRIIMGKLRLDVHPVELAPVIEAAIDAVRPAAEAKEIRLQPILDPRASPVSGDPNRLQQIVWNLVLNAVKFTPRGGRIQVRLERVNSHIEIIVSDTGQGIEAGLLPYIFDRFQQGDSSSTRMHGGLGLGLAIVRHLVELHGGTVHASSPGASQGTTFTVKLPLLIWHGKEDGRVHPTAGRDSETLEQDSLLDGLKVLIVDDEPDTREMLKVMIERFGAEVKAGATSAEALDLLEQWRPNVIVSDIEMPGEDGYSLIKKIRALEPLRGGAVPAVALTAYARAEDRMRALSAGYQMHVAKPAEPFELALVIASLVGAAEKDWPDESVGSG
jgi:PAS domain S-box-containing protein